MKRKGQIPLRKINQPQSDRLPWWSAVIILSFVVFIFLFYLFTELNRTGRLGFPLDDPWIHLTFARNLAKGFGFAYNQGEPVQGSTAPLWTLLLAFFYFLFGDSSRFVLIVKLLGMVSLYLSALIGFRIVTYITKNQLAGLITGLSFALLSHFGWAMVSGMEVNLSVALCLSGLYYHLKSPKGWKGVLPWFFFGLAVYTRPECLLLALFLILDIIISRRVFRYWLGLGIYLLTLLPYFALNLTLVNSLFPQTYVAKVGETSLFSALAQGNLSRIKFLLFQSPFIYFGGFIAHLYRANPILLILSLFGIIELCYQALQWRKSLLICFIALFYPPLLGMVAPFVGPAFQNGRYLGPPTAAMVLIAVLGGGFILRKVKKKMRPAVLFLLVIPALFNFISTGLQGARNTADAVFSINRQQVAIGEWLSKNTPKEAVIATNDVGAIGYFANRRILDLLGLITPEVTYLRKLSRSGAKVFSLLDYLRNKKPDYLVIFPNWFPDLLGAKFLTPVYVADILDNTASEYDFVPRARTLAGILITNLIVEPIRSTMVVFKCNWEVPQGAP